MSDEENGPPNGPADDSNENRDSNLEISRVTFRPLNPGELRKIQAYFKSKGPQKTPEALVDEISIILVQGFGFGSFNADLVSQALDSLKVEMPDLKNYLLSHSKEGESKKFIDVGKGSFKIDPLFLAKLTGEETPPDEGPIRKKVSPKKVAEPVRGSEDSSSSRSQSIKPQAQTQVRIQPNTQAVSQVDQSEVVSSASPATQVNENKIDPEVQTGLSVGLIIGVSIVVALVVLGILFWVL